MHSQFCVQVLDATRHLDPVVLTGIARGSHAARKHLLLASVDMVGPLLVSSDLPRFTLHVACTLAGN